MIVDRNELSTRLRLVQAENNPRRKQKNVRDNDRARSRSILLRYRDPRSIVISSQQGSNLLHLVARHSNVLFIYRLFNCSALASLHALYNTLYVVDRIILAIGIFVHCQAATFRKETTVVGLQSKIPNDGGKERLGFCDCFIS